MLRRSQIYAICKKKKSTDLSISATNRRSDHTMAGSDWMRALSIGDSTHLRSFISINNSVGKLAFHFATMKLINCKRQRKYESISNRHHHTNTINSFTHMSHCHKMSLNVQYVRAWTELSTELETCKTNKLHQKHDIILWWSSRTANICRCGQCHCLYNYHIFYSTIKMNAAGLYVCEGQTKVQTATWLEHSAGVGENEIFMIVMLGIISTQTNTIRCTNNFGWLYFIRWRESFVLNLFSVWIFGSLSFLHHISCYVDVWIGRGRIIFVLLVWPALSWRM